MSEVCTKQTRKAILLFHNTYGLQSPAFKRLTVNQNKNQNFAQYCFYDPKFEQNYNYFFNKNSTVALPTCSSSITPFTVPATKTKEQNPEQNQEIVLMH